MDLVSPNPGLILWTAITFLILLYILRKFAWKPILQAVTDRENSIESALLKADAVREEMARLTNENEALLKQARAERDAILADATKVKNQIIGEAKEAAQKEGARLLDSARMEINNQKLIAIADLKN